jgi:hypothetical protein
MPRVLLQIAQQVARHSVDNSLQQAANRPIDKC